jgi:aryl-alcohol dehydrogenase-like predicted oxidoreductase
MEQRSIGGFKVSVLGLGTGRLASLGAGGSLRDAARLLDTAADLGITFIDTADTYGSTQAERWLGELMHSRGQRFVVATKCGLPTVDLPWPLRALNQPMKKVIQRTGRKHYLDPAHVRRSIESSLKRLRRERLELYFIHEPPAGVEKLDELFSTLDDARTAGKIGSYGVCTPDAQIIRAVVDADRCEIVQTAIDPLVTDGLRSALKSVSEPGRVEVVANHVLGHLRPHSPVAGEAAGAQMAGAETIGAETAGAAMTHPAVLLDRRLDALSAERGISRAHLLIRHAAALGNVRVVLTGTGDPAHLADNAAALALPTGEEDLLT